MTTHPTDARELAQRILDDADLEAKHGSLSMLVPIHKMRALCSAVLKAPDAAPATAKVEPDAAKPREGDEALSPGSFILKCAKCGSVRHRSLAECSKCETPSETLDRLLKAQLAAMSSIGDFVRAQMRGPAATEGR